MKKFWKDNGLSLVLGGLFLLFWGGQSVAGYLVDLSERQEHQRQLITYVQYLASGHFWQATLENWESEFLQMAAYVLLTCFLFQRGSAESKNPDQPEPVDEEPEKHRQDPEAPGPVRSGGLLLGLYKRSLSLAFMGIFFMAFTGHAFSGWISHNTEQLEHGQPPEGFWSFLSGSQFWFESLQNWQSEFLSVLCIVVFSIWLRQQGSPESKPVHKPHHETGSG